MINLVGLTVLLLSTFALGRAIAGDIAISRP
jgi:hypothetical protein